MKSEIRIFCDSEAELREFVQRVLSAPTVNAVLPAYQPAAIFDANAAQEQQGPQTPAQPEKKPRKPRADAGQPRGPYKTGADAGTTASSAPGTTPAAGAAGGDPVTAGGPPATPTAAAPAPTNSAAPSEPTVQPGSTPGSAPAAAEPTMDDARAALGRINAVKGLGMNACMGHLAKFHVNRISLLEKQHFAEFIRLADAMIADHEAQAKKA